MSQWFTPEPTFKGLGFARALQARGHEVEVLTGFPNYPGGSLYPGYRIRPHQTEELGGIRIHRVALYPSHDSSRVGRVANYGSFALSAATIGAAVVRSADVAYVYHPPATIGLPALAIRALRRIPFVYDIQDLWPDTLAATGMISNKAVLKAVGRWCRLVYRFAAKIVVLSPGFKQALLARGVPAEKLEVVYNWCDEEGIRAEPADPERARALGMFGRFNIVFAGTMGRAQGLDTVLSAAQILENEVPHAQFVMIGGGIEVERLQTMTRQLNLKNVIFLPRVPMSEIGSVLSLSDALLVHLRDDPLYAITIPSKTQAYLAAGRPILMGVRGNAADIVREANAGVCFPPDDPAALAEAVRSLVNATADEREQQGRNGREFYRNRLCMEVGIQRFEQLFTEAALGRSTS
ncbi:MAG: glycosyltransferase family 4 protein [Gemmatimonadota bacterium]